MQETIAMIKTNLTESKAKLKLYKWVETITAFLNGEQKGVKQNQCYYSEDGKLTKVETGAGAQAKAPGGLRGKIIANQKEEMAENVKTAITKVQTYLPPDVEKLQRIYEA